MSLFQPSWEVAKASGWGVSAIGLLAFAGEATDPAMQKILYLSGLVATITGLVRTLMAYQKQQFRMKHYKNKDALAAVPPSDDDIDVEAKHPAKKPVRKPPTRKKAGDE